MSLRSDRPIEQRWAEFWALYHAGGWEPETHELLRATLKPGDLFVDVGAWIGPVSLWALECGARVIAIEPDSIAVAEIRRRLGGRIEIWEAAITVESGPTYLEARYGFGDSMARVTASGTHRVAGWTLEEVLAGRIPDLVKIDVEGYEDELLPAVMPYLADHQIPVQVALHNNVPDEGLFAAYSDVQIPAAPRDERHRSNCVVAR